MRNFVKFFIVAITLVSCQDTREMADAYGHFEADDMIVSSESNGRIIRMNIREGDLVKEGDTLAIIDTIQLVLQKKQLLASIGAVSSKTQNISSEIAVLEEKQAHLSREKSRVMSLLADSAATTRQLDDINAEINIVQKQITATRTRMQTINRGVLSETDPLKVKIDQLEDQLSRCFIIARQPGVVQNLYVNENEVTMFSKPICKISDMKTLYLRGYISGDQMAEVKLGEEITVKADGRNGLEDYKGTVTWISTEAEFTPKTIQTRDERVNLVYALKVRIANDGSLKIGMPGELYFNKPAK